MLSAFPDGLGQRGRFADDLARGIEDGREDARAQYALAVVLYLRTNPDRGITASRLRAHERAPLLHVHGSGLHQPDVPVNAGALIEPTVAFGRIDADQQHIAAAGSRKIGYVEAERIIAADVPANVEAVEDDGGLAIRAIEFDGDALASVRSREFEDAAIPADAGGRVRAPQRIEPLAGERWIVLEGQFDGPVVRQIDGLPVVVVEEQRADRAEVSGLGEVAPEIEILRHVSGMTEVEAPAEIEQQAFPAGYGSRGRERSGLGEGFVADRGLRRRHNRSRRGQTGLKQISTRQVHVNLPFAPRP